MTVYKEPIIDKLERKFGKYAIPGLMKYIIIAMGAIWLFDYIALPLGFGNISRWLYFDRDLILKGQVWRVLTFALIPTGNNILFEALELYFYWVVGNALSREWGNFKFDLFYLSGILGAMLAGFITGSASNSYMNMSLFLAFAAMYPNAQFILIIIPVKAKWMAALYLVSILITFITDSWAGRLCLVMSLLNLVLFFGHDVITRIKDAIRQYKWKKNWK